MWVTRDGDGAIRSWPDNANLVLWPRLRPCHPRAFWIDCGDTSSGGDVIEVAEFKRLFPGCKLPRKGSKKQYKDLKLEAV